MAASDQIHAEFAPNLMLPNKRFYRKTRNGATTGVDVSVDKSFDFRSSIHEYPFESYTGIQPRDGFFIDDEKDNAGQKIKRQSYAHDATSVFTSV